MISLTILILCLIVVILIGVAFAATWVALPIYFVWLFLKAIFTTKH